MFGGEVCFDSLEDFGKIDRAIESLKSGMIHYKNIIKKQVVLNKNGRGSSIGKYNLQLTARHSNTLQVERVALIYVITSRSRVRASPSANHFLQCPCVAFFPYMFSVLFHCVECVERTFKMRCNCYRACLGLVHITKHLSRPFFFLLDTHDEDSDCCETSPLVLRRHIIVILTIKIAMSLRCEPKKEVREQYRTCSRLELGTVPIVLSPGSLFMHLCQNV